MKILNKKSKKILIGCAFAFMTTVITTVSAAENKALFEGEKVAQVAGFPAVTRFIAGEKSAPLVVFIPGANHMARIAYGGHAGSNDQDFLAHWLHAKGYNFLGVSYPLDTRSDILTDHSPEYSVTDWGRQAMELAKQTIANQELSGEVIVVGWSMGGKIPSSVQNAAKDLGVNLESFIALSGTPAVPGLMAYDRLFDQLDSGYADRRKYWNKWHKQIQAMADNSSHEIIPLEVYTNDYLGDGPVGLEGFAQRYKDGKFVSDYLATFDDDGAFKYAEYPLVGIVVPDGRADARHAVTDIAVWNFYNANTIYKRYVSKAAPKLGELSEEKWQGILDLTESAHDRLSLRLPGNHFFFVGESGARATAAAIDSLYHKIRAFKQELGGLLEADLSQF